MYLAVAVTLGALTQAPVPSPAGVVRIDVIAADARGRVVANLTAADFELTEDATLQAVEEARFVRIDPANDGRQFAIYLDEYHVSPAGTALVREVLARFVDQFLCPHDLVTIRRPLDSLLTIRLTSDRNALHQAIAAFEGRKGDYSPRTEFERNYMANTPGRADSQRAQVTWSALNALAVHLGTLGPGRKTMVLVSEGLPVAERRRGFELMPTFASVVRAANRSAASIYIVDPRGPGTTDDNPDDDATARALASETDGSEIAGGAGLGAGLERMMSDSSAYYVLTYRSDQRDGRFHPVEVHVRRRGVSVRARKGFFAPSADDLLRAELLSRAREPAIVPPEPPRHISQLILPWFGLARGADGKTRVTFLWEATRVPGDRRAAAPARVVLTVRSADGATVFEGTVLPTGAGAVLDTRNDAAARAVFETTPGRLRLQMSIEDAAARRLDSDVRDIVVGDLKAPVALGTPEVLRARTARDVRMLDGDPDAVPVAAREFSRTERLVIRIPAYGPDHAGPTVSATLRSRMGQTMRTLSVEASARDGRSRIDLPLAGLASGDYVVEIVAKSPSGQATDLVTFRVTN